ncbi:hypothetical protein GCM10017554_25130 [Acinetobacter modestus]|nr:hypothetical protein GCM10017554_25130 [Acinetobacter modestus]
MAGTAITESEDAIAEDTNFLRDLIKDIIVHTDMRKILRIIMILNHNFNL